MVNGYVSTVGFSLIQLLHSRASSTDIWVWFDVVWFVFWGVSNAVSVPKLVPVGKDDGRLVSVSVAFSVAVPILGPVGINDGRFVAVAVKFVVSEPIFCPVGKDNGRFVAVAVEFAVAVPPLAPVGIDDGRFVAVSVEYAVTTPFSGTICSYDCWFVISHSLFSLPSDVVRGQLVM